MAELGDNYDVDAAEAYRALIEARRQGVESAFSTLQAPQGEPQGEPETPPAPSEGEDTGAFGTISDVIVRGVGGGLRDAGVNTAEGLQSILGFSPQGQAANAILDAARAAGAPELPELGDIVPDTGDPQTLPGGISKGLTQFLSLFIPVAGQLRAAGLSGRFMSAAAQAGGLKGALARTAGYATEGAGSGAIADYFAFDPTESRLSNLLKEWGVDNSIVDTLAAEEDDGEFEGRLKNVVEGLAAGGVAGPVVGWLGRAVGAVRAARRVRGADELADAPQGVVGQVEAAGAAVREARDHTALVRSLQQSIENGGTVADEALEQLARLDPEAAAQGARFLTTDLPRLADEATAALDEAESAYLDTLRTAEAPVDALERLREPVDAQAPPELADHVVSWRAQQDEVLAGRRPVAEPDRELAQSADESTIEAGFAPAIRVGDETLYTGERGWSHADVWERNPIDDAQLDKADMGFVRDGVFHGREEATDIVRRELGQPPREAVRIDYQPFGNRLLATRGQVLALRSSIASGDMDGAANALGEAFDSTNLTRITDDEGVRDLLSTLAKEFSANRGSQRAGGGGAAPRSLEETERLAREMLASDAQDRGITEGLVLRGLNQLLPGVKDLDVKLNAARLLEISLGKKVNGLAKQALLGPPTLREEADFVRYATLLANVNDARSGLATQIGRALSSLRITADESAAMTNNLRLLVQQAGGSEQVRLLADRLVQAGGSSRATREVLRKSISRTGVIKNMLVEHFLNSILSSPVTLTVNALSNTAVGLYLPLEEMLSASLKLDSTGVKAAMRMYVGMFHGLRASMIGNMAGWRATAKASGQLLTGRAGLAKETILGAGSDAPTALRALSLGDTIHAANAQFDIPTAGAISSDALMNASGAESILTKTFQNPAGKILAKAVDAFGVATRWPTRTLTAFDEIAKAASYHAKLYQQAYDMVSRQGLTGQAADDQMRFLVENASRFDDPALDDAVRQQLKSFDESARSHASYATFTNDLPAGSFSQTIQKATVDHPWMRLIVPFVRTPVNILKFALERTPAGPLKLVMKEARDQLRSGDPAVVSRFMIGSAFGMQAVQWAMEGRITGNGPVDFDQQEVLRQSGWQPRSLRIEKADGTKQWVEVARFDPISSLLIAAADIAEMGGRWDETTRGEKTAMFGALVAKNITSKAYMQGLNDAVMFVSDPQRFGSRFLSRIGGSLLVPSSNLFAQMRRVEDPTLPAIDRTSFTMELGSRLASRLPTGAADAMREFVNDLSNERNKLEDVPALNLWGEKVILPMGVGPDIMSPFFAANRESNPVREEIARLRVPLDMRSMFSSLSAGEGPGIKLTPSEQNRYIELTANPPGGKSLEKALESAMASPRWQELSGENYVDEEIGELLNGQAGKVKQIINAYRSRARKLLLRENTELAQRVQARKVTAKAARTQRGLEALNTLEQRRQANQGLTGGDPQNQADAQQLLRLLGGGN